MSNRTRVLRGGCWFSLGRSCRSAFRLRYEPGHRYFSYGFRLAAVLEHKEQTMFTGFMEGIIEGDYVSWLALADWFEDQGKKFLRPRAAGKDDSTPWVILSPTGVDIFLRYIPFGAGHWVADVPVTQQLWKSIMGSNPSHFEGDQHPVETVSWFDCQEFIEKLNALTPGWTFSLPKEDLWEFACRAGTEGDRYGELDDIAWYHNNSNGTTHPVREKLPNAFGMYDMLGNVWEWCLDFFDRERAKESSEEEAGATAAGTATRPSATGTDLPTGSTSADSDLQRPLDNPRVLRGGSWVNYGWNCRSAYHGRYMPEGRFHLYGFRLASILTG